MQRQFAGSCAPPGLAHQDDHRREDEQQSHTHHYGKKKLAHLPLMPEHRLKFIQSGSISTIVFVDLN
jgi:hypothetical protein